MKTIEKIKTIYKVCKILNVIGFVVSIIGISACLISLIVLPIVTDVFESDVAIKFISDYASADMNSIYFTLGVDLVISVSNLFITIPGKKYFSKELKDSDPFNEVYSKETFKYGLTILIVSVITVAILETSIAIRGIFTDLVDVEYDRSFCFVYGVFLLFLSLIYKLASERNRVIEHE